VTRVGTRPVPRIVLLVGLLAGLLLTGVATASPAAAHATLVSTDPAEGARLDAVPEQVTLEFSESVSLAAGYARVLTAEGERLDTGAARVDGTSVVVPLRTDVPEGGYLVTYRVISADSHPIAGAFSFVVGDGELVAGPAAGDADVDRAVAALMPTGRWLGYGGTALAIGVPVLALTCWPGGWASSRLRRLAAAGTALVAVSAVAVLLVQGPYAAGTGLGSALDPALLGATIGSSAGWTAVLRLVLVLGLALVLRPAWRRGAAPGPTAVAAAAGLALGLVLATAATGHPLAGPWPVLAVLAAAVHVAASSVWLGGLAGLAAGLLRPGTDPREMAAGVARYSRLAFGAVLALVVSGVVQAVREVGSPTALTATSYGRILLVKLALVLVVLAAAGVSRVWVQQRLGVRPSRRGGRRRSLVAHAFAAPPSTGPEDAGPGTAHDDDAPEDTAARARRAVLTADAAEHVPALRRSVGVELLVAVVVLAMSALLVATPPARSAVAQPVDVVLPLQGAAGESGTVQISVDPAATGPNVLHVYLFDDAGRLTQPAGIEVTLSEPGQQIGPLEVELEPAGPGHYVGDGMTIPGAGTWTLAVSVRVDEFTATTARTSFPVR
jgi:copper transport protein